jgi:hypothetical protein
LSGRTGSLKNIFNPSKSALKRSRTIIFGAITKKLEASVESAS